MIKKQIETYNDYANIAIKFIPLLIILFLLGNVAFILGFYHFIGTHFISLFTIADFYTIPIPYTSSLIILLISSTIMFTQTLKKLKAKKKLLWPFIILYVFIGTVVIYLGIHNLIFSILLWILILIFNGSFAVRKKDKNDIWLQATIYFFIMFLFGSSFNTTFGRNNPLVIHKENHARLEIVNTKGSQYLFVTGIDRGVFVMDPLDANFMFIKWEDVDNIRIERIKI